MKPAPMLMSPPSPWSVVWSAPYGGFTSRRGMGRPGERCQGLQSKKDGNVALVGVASLPREMEDDFPEFAEVTLKFLKKYGDRLKSVVVHDDEPHPHLHFTVIPRKGERFDDIHED